MPNLVYVNGQLIPSNQPAILATDRGFTLGDGLFETMRTARGQVQRLPAHLERLARGAEALQIPVDIGKLPQAISETLAANNLDQADASIRLTLSRGAASRGLTFPANPQPTLVISVQPFIPYPERLYRQGMKAVILEQRRNEFAATATIKSLNYLEGIVAKNQAQIAGADEGIFLNTQGFLAEACISNLFFVKEGALHTPSVECGLVPGIIRQTILQITRNHSLPLIEGKYKASSLLSSDEAFLTNTLMGIMPLTQVDQQTIGQGQPGEMTLRLNMLLKRET